MWLVNERQLKAFREHRFGLFSLYFFVFLLILSMAAEFISNSKPLYLKYEGRHYFPIFENVTNKDLNIESPFVDVAFRELENQKSVTILWPLIPYGPYESDQTYDRYPSKPDSKHYLGTDNRGRDVASRLLYGLRNSLLFAFIVWIGSYVLGIIVGALQGYYGGTMDFATQRVIEIVNSIPTFFLIMILASFIQPNLYALAVINISFGWIGISYYIRAEFLKLRKLEYIEAARSLGLSQNRLFLRHLIPNSLTPVITTSPFAITSGIASLAALDYLGFGLAPPAASWGELLNQGKQYFDHAWWLAFYPSLFLALTLICINFIGEALREALDPRAT